MSFNCSIFLEDIDINCNAKNAGGIDRVVLGLQRDLTIDLDPVDETLVTHMILENSVVFAHNGKDGVTSFNEAKNTSNGLGLITTDIIVRLPVIDRKMNKIDYMSRREDIVCLLYHNNGSVTVSGWMDGLTMNYSASSGTRRGELSYVDVTLTTDSWIASLAIEDAGIIDLP
jgi:hypothetical protein